MLRIARVVAAGYPHHSSQRGNYRQKVFYYIKKEPKGWKEFTEAPNNPDEMKGVRKKTKIGRPLGTNDFVERLERQLKRFLN